MRIRKTIATTLTAVGIRTVVILAAISASIALADDFKTVNGKEYKNATVTRVEPDGLVIKYKSGISKIYFTELPKEVQERFHYDPAKAAQFNAAQQAAIAQSNAKAQREAEANAKAMAEQSAKAAQAQQEVQVRQVVVPQAPPPVSWLTSVGGGGNLPSSARFKDEIKAMGNASDSIFALKPVTFRYKQELDPLHIPQFGLVAEEVEKVNPELVTREPDGKLHGVRYDAVNAMLLNEFLKEHRKVEEQGASITQLKREIEAIVAHLKEDNGKNPIKE
ncbi:MAG TPA: tail fiber domain-containing protein [Candidatus Acidoferrum sp.]